MTAITPYNDWHREQVAELEAKNADVECPDCEGTGEKECHCCSHESECLKCDGSGSVSFRENPYIQPNTIDYFNQVIVDLKQFCVWTRKDFLGEAGHFVQDFRPGNL